MASTSESPSSLVPRASALVKDAIREGRSRCTRGTQPQYIEQLAWDALNPQRSRSKCVEQFLAFVVDIAQRGELVDAEEIGLRVIALAREASPDKTPELSFAEAHMAEERAEGETEDAEIAMVHRPTRANYDRFLRSSAVHTSKRRDLEDVVRTLQMASA
jgi:hypothetical protein